MQQFHPIEIIQCLLGYRQGDERSVLVGSREAFRLHCGIPSIAWVENVAVMLPLSNGIIGKSLILDFQGNQQLQWGLLALAVIASRVAGCKAVLVFRYE